jgi:hypothetical protein
LDAADRRGVGEEEGGQVLLFPSPLREATHRPPRRQGAPKIAAAVAVSTSLVPPLDHARLVRVAAALADLLLADLERNPPGRGGGRA